MKWVVVLKEKLKIASLLTFLSVIIILFNLLMKRSVSQLEASVESIYSDRLVAGATIFAIIENSYENHLLLEEHIQTNQDQLYTRLEQEIKRNNLQSDSLLTTFKQTVLVEQEKEALKIFEQRTLSYREFQNQLLLCSHRGEKKAAYAQYVQKGHNLFEQVLAPAHQLSGIQLTVGEDIYKASKSKVQRTQVISTLEAALVVIILLLIYALLMASNSLFTKSQKFWLN